MKLFKLIILFVFILGCKKGYKNNTNQSEQEKKEIKNEKKDIKGTIESSTLFFDTLSHKDLFDRKLIGLSIKDSTQNQTNRRYWLDFYTSCMGNSLTIFIDTKKQNIYFTKYSDSKNLKKEDIVYTYGISKIKSNIKGVNLMLNRNGKPYRIAFIKLDDKGLYSFEIDDSLKDTEMGRHKIFIDKAKESSFSEEGCGDFDG